MSHRYQNPIRGRRGYDLPPSSPVTAADVEDRLDYLEAGQRPIPVAPLSAAERLATLEEQQRTQRDILHEHSRVHSELSRALNALVTRFEGIERKLIIACVILFAGTSNGSKLASVVSGLFT